MPSQLFIICIPALNGFVIVMVLINTRNWFILLCVNLHLWQMSDNAGEANKATEVRIDHVYA